MSAGPVAVEVDPARERGELEEYLGAAFELSRLQRYQETLDQEFASCGDEGSFYRTSRGYLYNLTAFAMTRTKVPYLEALCGLLSPGARVLDYGCGIGSDGLALAEAGFEVEFADFDNPSTEYLRWRLRRRGLDCSVHDLEGEVPGGFDAAFAFDVIEHVPDAYAFLREMEQRAAVVEVNFLDEEHDQPLHHPLPVRDLVRYAASRDLRVYDVLHSSSHLVAYQPKVVGPLRRAANLLKVGAVRARLRVGRPSRR